MRTVVLAEGLEHGDLEPSLRRSQDNMMSQRLCRVTAVHLESWAHQDACLPVVAVLLDLLDGIALVLLCALSILFVYMRNYVLVDHIHLFRG